MKKETFFETYIFKSLIPVVIFVYVNKSALAIHFTQMFYLRVRLKNFLNG